MLIILVSLLLSLVKVSISYSLAFPSAEGYGANASGGRGGSVCYVTSLADSGANTFRDCITRSGTRNILFKVSGTIVTESVINVFNGNLTIAGQTSPGGVHIRWVTPNIDGRTVAGGVDGFTGIIFYGGSDNIIIRHMHFRGGGYYQGDGNSNIQFYSQTATRTPHDFILDHITDMWTGDASPQYYGQAFDNATLQWSLVAEGANLCDAPNLGQTCPGSSKGAHIGGPQTSNSHVSIHHNAFISNGIRNPLIQGATNFDLRNNFVYNWYGGGGDAGYFGEYLNNASALGNIINNVYVLGIHSSPPVFVIGNILGGSSCGSAGSGTTRVDGTGAQANGSKIYTSGNWGRSFDGSSSCIAGCPNDWELYGTPDWYEIGLGCITQVPEAANRFTTPMSVAPVVTHNTNQVESIVLASVGANKPFRDSIDTRVINSTVNRSYCGLATFGCVTVTGGNSASDWDIYNVNTPAPTDTDGDGIPDSWELSHGLNPNNASDGATTSTNPPYTWLEVYLNELAGDGQTLPEVGIPPPSNLRLVTNQ